MQAARFSAILSAPGAASVFCAAAPECLPLNVAIALACSQLHMENTNTSMELRGSIEQLLTPRVLASRDLGED